MSTLFAANAPLSENIFIKQQKMAFENDFTDFTKS